jgi:uncharacterized membrane protein YcaP (DUF421 family)
MDSTTWTDMFHLGLPVLEKVIRPIIVYLFLVIGLRISGKRELAQINSFDLVVLMMLSNTVQNAIIGDDNSVSGGIIGAVALLAINFLVVRYISRHQMLEKLVQGKEDTLITNGHINRKRLASESISVEDLEMAARKQGFASLKDVNSAVLEPSGTISFMAVKPSHGELEHKEVVDRLDKIEAQLAALVGSMQSHK